MRTLRRNKRKMYYSLFGREVTRYAKDEEGNIKTYTTNDGEVIKLEEGTEIAYSKPVEFWGNIAMSGGEVREQEYGLNQSDYSAVLIMNVGEIPITETSYIWFNNEVVYLDEDKTMPDVKSADYRVKKVSPSLNFTKYLLEKITK